MNLYEIVFNRWERLRSGWRVLLFVVLNYVFAASLVLAAVTALYLFSPSRSPQEVLAGLWGWIIQSGVLLVAAVTAGLLCAKLLEGLPGRSLGWSAHKGWAWDWLKGTLVGALSLGLAALLIFLSGGYRFTFSAADAGVIMKTLVISGLVFIVAASAEEAIFRGYPLQTMTRARLASVGLVLTSLVFAYIHRNNPNNPEGLPPFTYIGIDFINIPFINTALAGVWLAVGYLRTRSLWFPLGLHWSWNWTMGAVLGLPVSGLNALTPAPLLRASDVGPVWLTGGAYGVEGGAACTLALLLSTLFVWGTRWLEATPEMMSLTDRENPKSSPLPPPGFSTEKPVAGEGRAHVERDSTQT